MSPAGFAIYFGYGIHHSLEGSAARPSPDTEMRGFKPSHELRGPAMSPEKEAFLHNGLEAESREEDDEDDDDDDGDF